ncbi:MAG: hypothetical protein NT069_15980 [Planctomycetota bacterium]|nr:hypothetical protein [Planctomycetota bacterium]
MRSRMPPAGWAGALLLLISGCASAWNRSGQELSSGPRSAPSTRGEAGGRAKVQSGSVAKSRRGAPRPGPAVDTHVLTADVDPGRTDTSRATDTVQPVGGLLPSRKGTTKPKPVDPAAAEVVDQEFPDAGPEEKQGILADMEGMSPSNMRAMLRAWKQGLARKNAVAANSNGKDSSREPVVNPAAATEESTTTRIKKSLSAGLGSVTAWGTAIVGGKKPDPAAQRPPVNSPSGTSPTARIEEVRSGADEEVGRATARELPGATESNPRDTLKDLIELAEAEVADMQPGPSTRERDEFISKHVSLRMLYLVGGRHELAMQAIPEIDPIDQEFWQHLFWGLANYFDAESLPSQDDRAAESAAQLTQAVLKLQRRAHLEVRYATFCDQIEGFGVYEPCESNSFHPGQDVLLYAEFGNVLSVLDESGLYRTNHISVIELSANGSDADPVERIELPETVDRCRRPRRDYYHSYVVAIPPTLEPGAYVLKLTVTDLASKRQASHSLNFRITPAPDEPTSVVDGTTTGPLETEPVEPRPQSQTRGKRQNHLSARAPDGALELQSLEVESDERPTFTHDTSRTMDESDTPADESDASEEAADDRDMDDLPPLPPMR